jgi:hypothetical protein
MPPRSTILAQAGCPGPKNCAAGGGGSFEGHPLIGAELLAGIESPVRCANR